SISALFVLSRPFPRSLGTMVCLTCENLLSLAAGTDRRESKQENTQGEQAGLTAHNHALAVHTLRVDVRRRRLTGLRHGNIRIASPRYSGRHPLCYCSVLLRSLVVGQCVGERPQ